MTDSPTPYPEAPMSWTILGRALIAGGMLLAISGGVQAQPAGPVLTEVAAQLAERFPDEEARALAAALDSLPEGVTAATLGQLFYARRQFDRSAWLYAMRSLQAPENAAALSNFAGLLLEVHGDDPQAPGEWPEVARDAARRATELAPDAAPAFDALGLAELRLGHAEAAAAAFRRATELAPDESLYWANLARALEASGDSAAAAAALARAHELGPNGPALLEALSELPELSADYRDALAPQCNIDFKCQEICPHSIIGGLMSVTCEIDNASAVQACRDGQPHSTSYQCAEELPEYGILIPGLNAGFSVAVPGFSAHVLVDGQGNVDVRVEVGAGLGPIKGYLRGDGHFTPSGGASFTNLGGGARISLFGSSPAGQVASGLDQPPAHIEIETKGGEPLGIDIESYNVALISF